MKREKRFESEEALCEAFASWARGQGFTVYAETAGWDMLLVTDNGLQLGIEAKLALNLKVISQALGSLYSCVSVGPDFRGILVPAGDPAVNAVLAHCGISVFSPSIRRGGNWDFQREGHYEFELHDWNPIRRCDLPEYVPDVPAGVPAPRTLSPWKVGALRVLALLELHGFVTRDDVRRCRNDPRRWCASDGWLSPLGNGRWGPGTAPRFDQQHPDVYAQILAEARAKEASTR
ncbi:hypothetical protein [Dyella sp. 2RAB6]|uniref:hypothetical protein n=1 Tax=Dyella sp. 2RAB6 TaxID=3232992 RepID=UPI003F9235E7